MRLAATLAFVVSSWGPAMAAEDSAFVFDDKTPVPEAVMALERCDAEPDGFATRRAFAGGFVFTLRCPGNNENFMQTLIFADAEDGTGARLLTFCGPGNIRDDFADVISNLRWYSDRGEVGEIFDRETDERADPNVCRTEGRWRLEGSPPEPKLVFWRQTADCDGKKGWSVIVDED
jgi:hypothetical protein